MNRKEELKSSVMNFLNNEYDITHDDRDRVRSQEVYKHFIKSNGLNIKKRDFYEIMWSLKFPQHTLRNHCFWGLKLPENTSP